MSKYDVETKLERDADGRVIRWGARWAETAPALEQFLIVIATMSAFAVVAGLFWLIAGRQMNPLLGYGLLVLIIAVWMLVKMTGSVRAVYFHGSGRMETPFGIYYRPNLPAIGGHHQNIVSIEARVQQDQPQVQGGWNRMYEVVMLSRGGDLICVSRNMLEWSAIKAAAQLTHALAGIRREQAESPAIEHEGAWATLN